MLTSQTPPLAIAATVLPPEVIKELLQSRVYTAYNRAYLILDRWALEYPDELRAMTRRGTLTGVEILLNMQMIRETEALNSETALEMAKRGMSDSEILQVLEIPTYFPNHDFTYPDSFDPDNYNFT